MIGLFLKDVINLKQQAKIFLVIAVMFIGISILQQDSNFFAMYMVVFTILVSTTAFAYDDKAKWDRYALTMPVSGRDIVLSKYLLVFVFTVLAFFLTFLLTFSMTHAFHESLTECLTISLASLALSSIILPVFFKFGVEKGRIVMMAIVLAPSFLSLLLSNLDFSAPAPAILNKLEIFAPFAVILILVLSVFLSMRIYEKKEF